MTASTKPMAKDKIDEGKRQIGNFAAKTAARPEVQVESKQAKKVWIKQKVFKFNWYG